LIECLPLEPNRLRSGHGR